MAMNVPLRPTRQFWTGQLLTLLKHRAAVLEAFRQVVREHPRHQQAIERLKQAARLQRCNPDARHQMDGDWRKLCTPDKVRAEHEHVKHSDPMVAERTRHEFGVALR